MEVLKKEFIFSENNDYNIVINLKSNYKLIGLYNSLDDTTIPQSQDFTSTNIFTITAITDSKLNDIRGYDPNEPFKVGVNGVTEINDTYIAYTIDGIEYTTTYSGNTKTPTPIETTYTTIGDTTSNGIDNNSKNLFIYKDEKQPYIERGKETNTIFLERSPIAINDFFFKLNHINTADDFATYFS